MALPGSHIRVALEFKEKLKINDLNKYISGTVYPDSRYVTGIARTLTHDSKYKEAEFYKADDFKKGWAVHLIYDTIQRELIFSKFDSLMTKPVGLITYGDEVWIPLTAIKVLQDFSDVMSFPIKEYLPCLTYSECPHNEEQEVISRYNQNIIKLYSNFSGQLRDYRQQFKDLGMSDEMSEVMLSRIQELSQNEGVMVKIKELFPETISIFHDRYPTL